MELDESISMVYEVEFWACNVESHHHKTKPRADKCIRRRTTTKRSHRKEDYYERNIAIAKAVLEGDRYGQVAEKHGISAGRVRGVFHSILRKLYYLDNFDRSQADYGLRLAEIRPRSDYLLTMLPPLKEKLMGADQ